MLLPFISAWVEESDDTSSNWITSSNVRSLVVVTGKTGQREIPGSGPATVLAGNDVVNLEGKGVVFLLHLAVLTGAPSAPPDQTIKAKIHCAGSATADLSESAAGFRFHKRQHVAGPLVVFELEMFFESQLSQPSLFRQLIHAVNVQLGKPKGENVTSQFWR
jgi:hypothetical protein